MPYKIETDQNKMKKVDYIRLPTLCTTSISVKVPARVEDIELSYQKSIRLIGKYEYLIEVES